ncbi:MAG: S1 RNA-binding domain-containing protein [Phycisphaerales bacterium]|nr:S1 RNA-binding domain-containing protein [Phycisphaerales bacterium]
MNAEIEAAMKDMDAAAREHLSGGPAGKAAGPGAGGAAKAPIRGPRLVQAGREQRPGKVVSVGPTDVFIEFGPKELGVIPRLQWPDDKDLPAKDDVIDAVVSSRDSDGLLVCSRPGAVQKADWELLEPGQVVEGRVTGVVQGKTGNAAGLELEVAHHRAFMPASQISLDHVKDLSIYVGEKMTCEIARVDRSGKGNIILSRRNLLQKEKAERAQKMKETLQEGQTLEGTVRKIMPFGAFVDIGGVDGLVHLSDMTYDRAGFGEKAVAKYVTEGQKVTVRILKLDWEQDRISLGIKQVQGDPFATAINAITEGAEITGRVTKILEFGAFIEVQPGVEGLVHISELDHKRVARVDDVVKQDEIVRAKVLKVDPETRRISLSLKALKPLPEISLGSGKPGAGGRKGRGEGGRSAEEILKETPALRRMREQARNMKFKGGLS